MQQLLQYLTDQKIPEVARIKEFIPTIEKRAKISVSDHLGKQPLTSPLQTKTDSNYKYYGELNADGKEHGRGIFIYDWGEIEIGYYENSEWSTGTNYIYIYDDGVFLVGERYMREGRRRDRRTVYKTDGKEEKYDQEN